MNLRNQILCAACGPLAILLFFIGLATSGFFPPTAPGLDAEQIATLYQDRTTAIRLGTFIMAFSSGLVVPFAAAVTIQMKRIEGLQAPVLAYTQLSAGTGGILLFLIEAMFWSIAAYRPGRPPEITQALNDIAWFFTVMPFALIFIQNLAIGIAIVGDHRQHPIFPRWLGYLNFWMALLYVPGGLCTFFKLGPFAWNGLLAFWMPASVYCSWFVVMAIFVIQAARRQHAELGAARSGGPA